MATDGTTDNLFSELQAADYNGLYNRVNKCSIDFWNEVQKCKELQIFSVKNRAQSKISQKAEELKSVRLNSEENRARSEMLRRQCREEAAIAEKRINDLFGKYIIVTCAWCKTRINLISTDESQNAQESHGICESCYANMKAQISQISHSKSKS